jgi:hypothetical protein
MPTIDLSDDEHAAVTAAVRRTIDDDRYPRSPRLARLKAELAKPDPASAPKTENRHAHRYRKHQRGAAAADARDVRFCFYPLVLSRRRHLPGPLATGCVGRDNPKGRSCICRRVVCPLAAHGFANRCLAAPSANSRTIVAAAFRGSPDPVSASTRSFAQRSWGSFIWSFPERLVSLERR